MVKKILKIALWVITGAAFVMLFISGRKWYLETPLKGIDFHLERSHRKGFVEQDSVLAYAKAICDMEHHASLSSVDLMKIRKLLISNPWIESTFAYIGLNDTLVIKAKEYEPVLRVFNTAHRSVYVTEDGVIIPSSPIYSPRVLIASGDFMFPAPSNSSRYDDSIYAHTGIAEALAITLTINRDPFLAENIGQIHKNENNEYELMVNNLSAKVILGDTDAVDDKLSRLATLLQRYSGTDELEAYKTLDLRYKKQIVCTKQ